jgi:hypothetical protein
VGVEFGGLVQGGTRGREMTTGSVAAGGQSDVTDAWSIDGVGMSLVVG